MTIKPLAYALLATSVLTACSMTPVQQKPVANEPIVYTEPDLSPPFYALNPFNYDQPPVFELELQKASAQPVNKLEVTDPANPSKKLILDSMMMNCQTEMFLLLLKIMIVILFV